MFYGTAVKIVNHFDIFLSVRLIVKVSLLPKFTSLPLWPSF